MEGPVSGNKYVQTVAVVKKSGTHYWRHFTCLRINYFTTLQCISAWRMIFRIVL